MKKLNIIIGIVLIIIIIILIYMREWYALATFILAIIYIFIRRIRKDLIEK